MNETLTEQVCEFYGKPGQDCVTAGPEVVAAEGLCGSCAVRYLARPAAPDPRIEQVRKYATLTLDSISVERRGMAEDILDLLAGGDL